MDSAVRSFSTNDALTKLNEFRETLSVSVKDRKQAIAKLFSGQISCKQFVNYWMDSIKSDEPLKRDFISKKRQITKVVSDVYNGLTSAREMFLPSEILSDPTCGNAFMSLISDIRDAVGIEALKPLWHCCSESFPLQKLILQGGNSKLASFAMDLLVSSGGGHVCSILESQYAIHGDERALAAIQYLNLALGVKNATRPADNPRQFLSLLEFVHSLNSDNALPFLRKYYGGNIGDLFTTKYIKDTSPENPDDKINLLSWAMREYGPEHPRVKILLELLSKAGISFGDLAYETRRGTPIRETVKGEHAEIFLTSTSVLWSSGGDRHNQEGDSVRFFQNGIKTGLFLKEFPKHYGFLSLPQLAQCKKLEKLGVDTCTKFEKIRDFLEARHALTERGESRPQLTLDVRNPEFLLWKEGGVTFEQMKALKERFANDNITFLWQEQPMLDSALRV
jgi:hypothetical protein